MLLFSFWSKEMGLWVGSTLPNIFIIGSFECEHYDCVNIATAPRSKWTSAWTVYCSLQLSRYDFISFYHGEKKILYLHFQQNCFLSCVFSQFAFISPLFFFEPFKPGLCCKEWWGQLCWSENFWNCPRFHPSPAVHTLLEQNIAHSLPCACVIDFGIRCVNDEFDWHYVIASTILLP